MIKEHIQGGGGGKFSFGWDSDGGRRLSEAIFYPLRIPDGASSSKHTNFNLFFSLVQDGALSNDIRVWDQIGKNN
jgi:hypothetical protein